MTAAKENNSNTLPWIANGSTTAKRSPPPKSKSTPKKKTNAKDRRLPNPLPHPPPPSLSPSPPAHPTSEGEKSPPVARHTVEAPPQPVHVAHHPVLPPLQPVPMLITTATPPIVPSFAPIAVSSLPAIPAPTPKSTATTSTPSSTKKSTSPKPPCQACQRVLDSNRCMSSGLRERVIRQLPDGVTFKVKDSTCTFPPAKYLPEPRSDAAYLCQSCIKWLNKHTLPLASPKLAASPLHMSISNPNSTSSVALVPQQVQPVLPTSNGAIAEVPTSQSQQTTNPVSLNTNTIGIAQSARLSPVAGTPTAQEERQRLQEERHVLQEERARFLDERQRFQDEKDRLNDALNATRLELKNKRDECERLKGHANVLCEELISRLRRFASSCDGGPRKRSKSS